MISAGDAQKRVQAAIDGIVASGAHVLVERGELDYDMRAVEVWPEFGAHGKDRVTLHHVLMHTAGVPAPPYDTTVEDLCDWHHMCDAGVDLVSPARRAVMAAPAFEGPDEVMDVPTTWGVRVQPLPSRRGPVP
ncbi:MAG TPA: serine hydrolase domain-containing protein, partial [Acidimicrobiales bacterium]